MKAEKKNDCRFKGGYFKMGDPRDACFLLLNDIEYRETNDARRKGDHQRRKVLDKEEPG